MHSNCSIPQLTLPPPPFFFILLDRTWRMLPGAFPRHTLKVVCQQPLYIMPVQRAGELPLWLLRGSVAHQHGQAKRGTPAT